MKILTNKLLFVSMQLLLFSSNVLTQEISPQAAATPTNSAQRTLALLNKGFRSSEWPKDTKGRPAIVYMAHRGAWGAMIAESSNEAFKVAVDKQEIAVLELDMYFTRDGFVWLHHDNVPDRKYYDSKGIARNGASLWRYSSYINTYWDLTKTKDNRKKGIPPLYDIRGLKGWDYNFFWSRKDVINGVVDNNHRISAAAAPVHLLKNGELQDYNGNYQRIINSHYALKGGQTPELTQFVNTVKGKIVLDIDKFKDPKDYQRGFIFLKKLGLINQSIIKVKVSSLIEGFEQDASNMSISRVKEKIKRLFNINDYDLKRLNISPVIKPSDVTHKTFRRIGRLLDILFLLHRFDDVNVPIYECIYNPNNNNVNGINEPYELRQIARKVQNSGRLVLQFIAYGEDGTTNGWSGAGNKYYNQIGTKSNYLQWLFHDGLASDIKDLTPNVIVTDFFPMTSSFLKANDYILLKKQ